LWGQRLDSRFHGNDRRRVRIVHHQLFSAIRFLKSLLILFLTLSGSKSLKASPKCFCALFKAFKTAGPLPFGFSSAFVLAAFQF